jgi:2-amino-4-hydroxy-6-hydroxymethyldihydropteridine diphosphokinase
MSGIFIALGSNLGKRSDNLRRALELMPPEVQVEVVSPVYESMPQPPSPPPAYYNAVCRVATQLEPHALLRHMKDIEARLGRRPAEHWAPRIIDLDIVLYNDAVLETPDLTVPHPRMQERAFVLRPLLDIAPEVRMPGTTLDLTRLLADLDKGHHQLELRREDASISKGGS